MGVSVFDRPGGAKDATFFVSVRDVLPSHSRDASPDPRTV